MKINKSIVFAMLVAWQVSACGESTHKHDEKDHAEHAEHDKKADHDDHKHEEEGHDDHKDEHKHEEKEAEHKDHDDHKHEKDEHDDHEKHEDHEEHGSHEHGAAQMTIAVGGNGLEIQLETPAANILGFEHEAKSDEDKETLKAQKSKLQMIDTLFAVNAEAKCVPGNSKVISPLFEEHDDHADEKHEHEEETHSDIDVNWTFNCKDSKAIDHVDVKLFSMFPKGFEKIKVDWVTDSSASTVSLTEDGMVKFK